MDQLMLTYLKVALWLADCSPSLSHIPCSVCCVLCVLLSLALWLRVVLCPVPAACPWLGCWVASGLPVPACACGVGLRSLSLPCCPLCASSSMPVGIRECVRPLALPHGCCPCALCALGPWTSSPAVPLALWSGRATSHCLPGVGVVAWPAGVGGSGCALVAEGGGCLDPWA